MLTMVGLLALSVTAEFCGYAQDLKSCPEPNEFTPNTTCANNRLGNFAFPSLFTQDHPRLRTLVSGKDLLGWTQCAEFIPDGVVQENRRGSPTNPSTRRLEVVQTAAAVTVAIIPSENCTLMLSNSRSTATGPSPLVIASPSDFTVKTHEAKATAICIEAIYEEDVVIQGVWNCPVSDCIACWKAWNHFKCQSKAVKTLLIILLLLLISLLPLSILISCWIAKCIYARWSIRTQNRVINNFLSAHEATSGSADGLVRRKPSDSEMVALNVTILISVFCLICPASASVVCTATPSGASPMTVCHQQGQYMNCSTVISTTATLIGLNSGLCLSTRDNFNKTHTLEIGLSSFTRSVALSKQYYTGSYNVVSSSHKRCPTMGACPKTGGCPSIASPSTSCTELSGAICALPGLTRCQDSCGCSGCKCFWCSAGCMFYRVAVQPTGEPYSVSIPSGVNTFAVLQICWDGVCTSTMAHIGTVVKMNNASILVNGLSASTSTIFGTRSVIRSSKGATWIQPASNPQGPVISSIGDYQTDTASNFLNPTPTNAIYPFTSVPVSFAQSSVSVGQPTPGIQTLLSSNQLPAQIYDTIWSSPQEAYLSGVVTSIPTVSLQITGSNNFVSLIKSACPTISTANFTGCYRCDAGATLELTMSNGCEAGPVTISATGVTLLNPVQSLKAGSSKMIVQLLADVKSADSEIKVCGETLCSSIVASFTLNEVVSIIPTGSTSSVPDETIKGGGGLNLSWLGSLTPLARVFLWIGVALAVVLVVLLLVFLAYKVWKRHKENKHLFKPLISEGPQTQELSNAEDLVSSKADYSSMDMPEQKPDVAAAVGLASLTKLPANVLTDVSGAPLFIVKVGNSYGLTTANPFDEIPIGALGYATTATMNKYPMVSLGPSGYE